MGREQDIIAQQIGDWNVCGISLFRMDEYELCLRLGHRKFEDGLEPNPFPVVIEPAPACNTMEIAQHLRPGQFVELLPTEHHRILYQSVHAELPLFGVEPRDRAI